jgi:putative transcriptional regulator
MAEPAEPLEPVEPADHRVRVHLDELLAAHGMTLVDLSAKVGVTVANLSILKNGHARAIRFSTLTAICDALHCSPGELLDLQHQETGPGR